MVLITRLLAVNGMSATTPLQQLPDASSDYQALSFFVNSILSHVRTAQKVQVMAVTGGGLGPIGTVDVKPLVSQVDGAGQGQPHGIVYGRPYIRWQGGTSAVILDPTVDDIGLLVCCDRDISNVIATLAAALPASLRRFNFADGIYIGCSVSNTTPTQYVQFLPASGGINVKSPGEITLTGSSINLNGATISGSGEVTDAAGKVLGTHDHLPGTYVAPSGGGPITGNSGAPV
jgi:hypothetical protein